MPKRKTNLKAARDSKLCDGILEEPNQSFVTECDLHLADLKRNATPQTSLNTKNHPYVSVTNRHVDRIPSRPAQKQAPLNVRTKLRHPTNDSFAETIQITLPRLRCLEAA